MSNGSVMASASIRRTRRTATCPSLLPGQSWSFAGLIYHMGGSDQLYGEVTQVTDGDTIEVEAQDYTTPVRLIAVHTPETVAPDQPVGCFGP